MTNIRLSQQVPTFLELCSKPRTPLGITVEQERLTPLNEIRNLLKENSNYHGVANFSSTPLGNEEKVYECLMRLFQIFQELC